MKKILSLLAILLLAKATIAQDKSPVQFVFSTQRTSDSLVQLTISAKLEKGFQLFGLKKQSNEDEFVSSLQLDNTITTDSIIEEGKLMQIPATDASLPSFRVYEDSVRFSYFFEVPANDSIILKGSLNWLGKQADEYPSGSESFAVEVLPTNKDSAENNSEIANQTLWQIFLLTFLTGLLAVITPCVFPLIPVTVSFFLKRSKTRAAGIKNALWYSLSIIGIYTVPTILLVLLFGDDILYQISTSAISNLLFFAIFLVFAISFFGAFELQLPNSWANKADQKAGKGGLGGIFFMALTLVIVSFSCTGPIVGTLLGQTSTGGVSTAPIIGMLGFGVGLALPFSLFAFFPSMLQSLPKSGGWLNSVKVSFGFIELALALKFLSNVDLIYHWRLLDRDVFLVLWIVIFVLLGIYLLGKLKFSHDSDLPYVSVPRLFFAIASFSFALYILPGLWGAPLRHLSGFIPPDGTQEFNLDALKYQLNSGTNQNGNTLNLAQPPQRLADKLHVPYGLVAYFTLEEGMAAAKALNKPIMLDFTGHSCANCRKMEKEVWKDPAVLQRMKENFVLVSLYVDESTELPIKEQYIKKDGDKVITEGDKNLDYEITQFGFNAQPLYMFLDLNGKLLSSIKYGYDPDIAKFIAHLDAAKAAFDKNK
ncbi:protein-disulfide reductase DsbD [Sediminibacterium sp.]|uniref:protein-disulfide reductase DsbD family protein n=1 Tax=Sediminibacterium sp. TaxID=1917865 RepID=UPI002730BBAB|nr:thioredoxin family protein [Sediminibacterium sp.]MDP2422088.1 thioredoxin family protein [Sediminibacterium sp.]